MRTYSRTIDVSSVSATRALSQCGGDVRSQIAQYADGMVAESADMLREWARERGAVRNILADFEALTLRIATRALFGETMPAAQARARCASRSRFESASCAHASLS